MTPLPDDAWDAWSPFELAQRLNRVAAAWYVVGGWALDLWHGQQTREHEDLEFAVFPEHLEEFRAILSDLDFFAAKDGILTYVAPSVAPSADAAQFWGADMRQCRWRVDMMLEKRDVGPLGLQARSVAADGPVRSDPQKRNRDSLSRASECPPFQGETSQRKGRSGLSRGSAKTLAVGASRSWPMARPAASGP